MRMDNEQNRSGPDDTNRGPAFFFIDARIAYGDRVGIVEYEDGGFKADAVPAKVLTALRIVPFKSH